MASTRLTRRLAALSLLTAAVLSLSGGPSIAQDADRVLLATVDGAITPVVANHLVEALDRAEQEGYAVLLVEMDTPGGLDTSMREIVKAFFGAEVPVVVYVAPAGARAASAGAIIGMAAHVLAMAPGTNIGAATPVDLQGGDITDKIINDAVAYAESIAEERGRDVRFARDAVRRGRSEPAAEAVDIGVADLVAPTRGELLDALDGTTVTLDGTEVTLSTAGARIDRHDMGFFARLRQTLADPNIAFLFLSIGTLAIFYELANPGIQLGGIVGVILLVLAFFSLSVLPVNVVGVVLLLLAMGLFVAELFAPGIGVFAAGGTLSLIGAGLFLFRGSVAVDLAVLIPSAIVVGGAVVVAGRLAWKARKQLSATGEGTYVGREAVVRDADGTRGRVTIDGTWWNVRSQSPLTTGQPVRITGMQALELTVEPVEQSEEKEANR